MIINKKVNIMSPKKCYLLFDLNVPVHSASELNPDIPTEKDDNDEVSVYNGQVKVFESLLTLNDHLLTFDPKDSSEDTDKKLYKGHVFPGSKFPLEHPACYDKACIFVIERMDLASCFVQKVVSLSEAAKTIGQEISIGEGQTISKNSIDDFLVFIGKVNKLHYCTIDSEE